MFNKSITASYLYEKLENISAKRELAYLDYNIRQGAPADMQQEAYANNIKLAKEDRKYGLMSEDELNCELGEIVKSKRAINSMTASIAMTALNNIFDPKSEEYINQMARLKACNTESDKSNDQLACDAIDEIRNQTKILRADINFLYLAEALGFEGEDDIIKLSQVQGAHDVNLMASLDETEIILLAEALRDTGYFDKLTRIEKLEDKAHNAYIGTCIGAGLGIAAAIAGGALTALNGDQGSLHLAGTGLTTAIASELIGMPVCNILDHIANKKEDKLEQNIPNISEIVADMRAPINTCATTSEEKEITFVDPIDEQTL